MYNNLHFCLGFQTALRTNFTRQGNIVCYNKRDAVTKIIKNKANNNGCI